MNLWSERSLVSRRRESWRGSMALWAMDSSGRSYWKSLTFREVSPGSLLAALVPDGGRHGRWLPDHEVSS